MGLTKVEKRRLEELRYTLNICFALIGEEDMKEVSNRTRLSVSTLYRLQSDKLTTKIQYRTVQAIVDAAGLVLTTEKDTFKLSLKKGRVTK